MVAVGSGEFENRKSFNTRVFCEMDGVMEILGASASLAHKVHLYK